MSTESGRRESLVGCGATSQRPDLLVPEIRTPHRKILRPGKEGLLL
jgi:hypothetical protein